MKLIIKFSIFLLFITLNLFSQKATDFKTVKYEEKVFETEDYKIFVAGSFARKEILKIKLRIFNKSKNILYIKPEEIEFTVNGKTIHGTGKIITVQPDGEETRLIDANGDGDMRCDQFELFLKGIYKADKGESVKANDTEIKGKSGGDVSAAEFKCEMRATQTNNEKSFAKYSCIYTGDRIGIIEPNNTVAIMSSGKQNYNSFPKNESFVLEKNMEDNITIEFRKLNGAGDLTDGYKVIWNNVFHIGKLVPYKAEKTILKIDLNKSE